MSSDRQTAPQATPQGKSGAEPLGSPVRFNLDAARIRPARLALSESRSPIGAASSSPDPLSLQRGDLVDLLFIHTDAGPARRARDKERLQACVAQRLADGSWVGVLITPPFKDVGPSPGEAFLFASVHVLEVYPLEGLAMLDQVQQQQEQAGAQALAAGAQEGEGPEGHGRRKRRSFAQLGHQASAAGAADAGVGSTRDGSGGLDYLALCEALLRGDAPPVALDALED